MSMWEDHLLPLLTCNDAVWLGGTCKALTGVVRDHFKDLGKINVDYLPPALTTFPRARTVHVDSFCGGRRLEELVRRMREGGRGRDLTRVTTRVVGTSFFHKALQAGALPSLRNAVASLQLSSHRASLTEGLLAGMHELQLTIECTSDNARMEPRLAALGLVGQLRALTELEVKVDGGADERMQWPPFIPPSLRSLRIEFLSGNGHVIESLPRALPGMLGASGARLDRLEVLIPENVKAVGDGLVHLAQALRCCSPTLKEFVLDTCESVAFRLYNRWKYRADWAEVIAGVSACRELEVLALPRISVEPLFPPGTAFDRLTHLEISDHEREHPPAAGVVGLWELMASGGLPALAKLSVRLEGVWAGIEEMRTRVVPALEAVAGTLTHLHVEKWDDEQEVREDIVDVGYELGVAVGKLRRLKDLTIHLDEDNEFYIALGRGLAASGGERPLPLLWQMAVRVDLETSVDQVANLLLPSVRIFVTCLDGSYDAALTACALRQAGYEHTWSLRFPNGNNGRGVAGGISCMAPGRIVHDPFQSWKPLWAILPSVDVLRFDETGTGLF
jgi:hypothetical protein